MNEDLDKHRFPQKVRNALLRFIDMLAVRSAKQLYQIMTRTPGNRNASAVSLWSKRSGGMCLNSRGF